MLLDKALNYSALVGFFTEDISCIGAQTSELTLNPMYWKRAIWLTNYFSVSAEFSLEIFSVWVMAKVRSAKDRVNPLNVVGVREIGNRGL